MATKLTPLNDRIVVRQSDAETTTASGIVLPDAAKEKPTRGEVVAVGSGKLNDDGSRAAPAVKAGDHVVYGKYAGTEVEHDGEKLQILRESDILGVIG